MLTIGTKRKIFCFLAYLYCLLFLSVSFCGAGQQLILRSSALAVPATENDTTKDELEQAATSSTTRSYDSPVEGIWDPAKYISIDEISPGMEAYCLTCYGGVKIEKFDLDVLSVVRNIEPGHDAILVQGTDERFIHTGPVAGCSGSPVYIDGRLAGAMAFAWTLSKDPLYGVTPIKEMLRVGRTENKKQDAELSSLSDGMQGTRYVFDFSRQIDFSEIDRQVSLQRPSVTSRPTSATTLPCPLIISGLPAEACRKFEALLEPYGLMAVPGVGGTADVGKDKDVQLAPGAVLTVPLVTGDIAMTVLGTATEVVDDKVYGFGHSLLGYGAIDLPMATGQVHTVVSNLARSFKLGSALEIVGALTMDESTAILGQIGAQPKMIPLTIKVDRFNAEPQVFNCRLANNQLLTPDMLHAAVYGAAVSLGGFPPDHTVEYKVAINLEDADSISFENVSTEVTVAEMIAESKGSVLLLMNNPFKKVEIKSLDFDIRILPKNILSHIWSVDLSDSTVKAGQQIQIEVVLESYLSEKKEYQFSLEIPKELKHGKYELVVSGSFEYEKHLRKTVPYRFLAQDITSLIEALNEALSYERDKLYCFLVLPPSGIAVDRAELPDLPETKTMVLQDATRALRVQPYPRWLEKSLRTGTVVIDKETMHIIVEK
jgi:hypothetical protein